MVDNNADFSSPIGTTVNITADSIRIDQLTNHNSMLDNVQYYWKVAATDNHELQGIFTSGNESFWFNSVNNPPPTPSSLRPLAGGTVHPSDSLKWTAGLDADPFDTTTFVIEISLTSNFSILLSSDTTRSSFVILNRLPNYRLLQDNTILYWRVHGIDQSDVSSGLAGGALQTLTYRSTAPALPVAWSPPNNAIFYPSEQLSWTASIDADAGLEDTLYYVLALSLVSDFSTLLSTDTSVDTFRTIEELDGYSLFPNNAQYYWRMRTVDNHRTQSAWSNGFNFILNKSNQRPPEPVILSPVDTAVADSSSRFVWHRSIDADPGNTVTYSLLIGSDSLLSDTLVQVQNLADTAFTLDSLLHINLRMATLTDDHFYYWAVAAKDNHQALSSFSAIGYFFANLANDTPAVPVSLQPSFGALVFPTEYLRWYAGISDEFRDTSRYIIQMARDSLFTDLLIVGDTVTADTAVRLSSLTHFGALPNEVYLFWRVAAVDQAGLTHGFSADAKIFFSLSNTAPSIPLNPLPSDSSVTVYPSGEFTWTASTDPDHDSIEYEVWISSTPFNDTTDSLSVTARIRGINDSRVVLNTFSIGYEQLRHHDAYYWRVRAYDEHFTSSNWSLLKSFRFASTPPTLVSVVFPQDSTTLKISDSIGWSSSSDADAGPLDSLRYEITVDNEDDFLSPASVDTLVSDTVVTLRDLRGVDSLQNDVYYFWRVRALDVHGAAGDYSGSGLFFFNRTNTRPDQPNTLYPSSSVPILSYRAFQTLRWIGTDPDKDDILSFRVEISRDSTFGTLVLAANGWDTSAIRLSDFAHFAQRLIDDSLYFWRVRAQDQQGVVSGSSLPGRFIYDAVDDQASSPVIVTPAIGGYMVSASSLSWKNSTDADDTLIIYRVSVSSDSLFTRMVAENSAVSKSSDSITSLLLSALSGSDTLTEGHLYYWCVVPYSMTDSGWVAGEPSSTMKFWVGRSAIFYDPRVASLSVVTPTGLTDTANIIRSLGHDLVIAFADSTVTRPVCVEITRIPVQGSLGGAYLELSDSANRAIQKKVIDADRYVLGDKHMVRVGEPVFSIRAFDLDHPDRAATLEKSVLLQFACHDTNQDGYADQTPQGVRIPLSAFSIFRLNEKTGRWEPVSSSRDSSTESQSTPLMKAFRQKQIVSDPRVVRALTPHFSIYTVMAYQQAQKPFEDFKVFPSPFLLSSNGNPVTLQYYLSEEADILIQIYSKTGGLVFEKRIKKGAVGGRANTVPTEIHWNGRNQAGRLVGNGVYIVKVIAKPSSGGEYTSTQYLGVVK
ncbi:MAG: hypothetical protein A2293_05895 [Elusimicrobia bacterium RIFOXYB2_FULL_49_7]|nr:MAG: hypothetical protein A2293_05895 [Elusimicrobia bacterium RIFOXYB2_FULL_49_7]